MDKSTLSNYGWIVIVTLVLAVMLALATPFGTFVGKGASNVIKTFVQSSDNAIDEDNIDTQSKDWDIFLNNTDSEHNVVVPEGGTYTDANGNTYTKGDNFPKIQNGDIYVYGNYTYTYSDTVSSLIGWKVSVTDKTKSNLIYKSPLSSINNSNTVSMLRTFMAYKEPFTLSDDFKIPNTVVNCASIFQNASGLTSLPDNFKIPDSVKTADRFFYGCTNLKRLPKNFAMPLNANSMNFMFENCTSLENTPAYFINTTTTSLNINHLFRNCTSLKEIPDTFNFLQAGNNPSDINSAGIFSGCTSLKQLPENFTIPKSFYSVSAMFYGCTNLTGTIIINCDIPIYNDLNGNPICPYQNCFTDTVKSITIKGTSPQLSEIAATCTNNNVVVG